VFVIVLVSKELCVVSGDARSWRVLIGAEAENNSA